MAWTPEEAQRRRLRKRLVRGLIFGSAAIGLPTLANALVARRASRIERLEWGRRHRYAWEQGAVAFQQVGHGPPVVLLHSFGPGHNALEWRRVAELLARSHLAVVPDFPGWGESEKPSLTYDAELYIRFLEEFLNDVVGHPAVVAAAGLAAVYSLQVAITRPSLIRGLVLVAPVGIDTNAVTRDLKDAAVHRLLRLPIVGTSALNLFTSRSGMVRYLTREIFADPEKVTASVVDSYYRASHLPGAQAALAAYLAGYLDHCVRGALGGLEVPVSIAWGRKTVSPAVASADLWLRELPGAELEVFPACGCLPHAEEPESFYQFLDTFLTTLGD